MSTIADISKLRESTGAGMMDCKKALDEAEGNIEKASEILRKKGIIKAAKRDSKIAAEGLTMAKADGNTAVILEINSETDFVAKSDDFINLIDTTVNSVLAEKPTDEKDAMTKNVSDGKTLQDIFTETVSKIGEKLNLRRLNIFQKSDDEVFGAYVHMGGKISALVLLSGTTNEELARDIAMHITASNPRYLDSSSVDDSVIEKEKDIATEQLKAQGKPENIIENIVKGKMKKFCSEVCLLEQSFIKDEDKTVGKMVEEAGAEIKKFVRFELGDGIEKQSCDFAAEVAEQMA